MSVKSQQVAKSETAKPTPPISSGGLTQVRGFTGNHTLMRKQETSDKFRAQGDQVTQRPVLSKMSGQSLQRKCACGGSGGECKACDEEKAGTLQRALQKKLAVSEAGDRYEQEADRVADQVLAAPMHSAVSGAPPQIQRFTGQSTGRAGTAPTSVDRVLATPGRPMRTALQQDMEQRFGHDFSRVRVHTDEKAAESARQVGAVAYTVGHHMVFDSARYAPQTSAGRRLLAHELSHTIQQGAAVRREAHEGEPRAVAPVASGVAPMVQRSVGFEFQTANIMTTSKNKQFERKAHKFFHQGKSGIELQSDTGSVVEFETKPARKWSEVEAQVQEAVDICRALNNTFGAGGTFAWNEEHRLEQMFTFSEEGRVSREKPLAKGEKLAVKIVQPKFQARIQSTEGFAISQFESFLKEHEKTELIDPVIDSTKNILDVATKANPKIKPGTTDNLRGFLALIVDYLTRGQLVNVPVGPDWSPTKAIFGLMSRTDFASIYQSLLTRDQRELFDQIIKSNAIPNELNIKATDALFKNGYWGHHPAGKMMALFKGGKIIALAKEDHSGAVHDCASKTNTSGLNVSTCGTTVSGTNITIDSWLKSIISNKKDLLSPPARGSDSMGKRAVKDNKPEEKDLILVEARGTRRNAGQKDGLPINDWLAYVEEVFKYAAFCRPRPGTGTELIYDGSDTFSWDRCLPPK